MLTLLQIAVVALRALTGLVFVWSGFAHARDPEGSSKDLGLPKAIGYKLFFNSPTDVAEDTKLSEIASA